ncbi:leucine-rich repeat domain-containing protein [Gulosibacter molinativorax]|uniref:Leucine-rich repeat domain-containing protein n=1 Tax=Gulosibacter molinativorax TaxID=256821 RepID=A0ABT7CC31_9MICO|nr:leucine-rich repeat domain-containing protein [Gulosibacter molinativorax]
MLLAGIVAILQVNRNVDPAHAAGPMTFELFATHPYASKSGYDNTSTNYYTGAELCPASGGQTFCPAGQTITDMEVTEDGELIAGYGDWNSNVDSFGVADGRVGVVPLNLATGTWGDMFYAGSEAIDKVRKINGKLYIPTTDPSDRAATGNAGGNISGYITNETGDWSFVRNGSPSNEHTFDIAFLGEDDIFTAGARPMSGGDISSVRHSADGGIAWQDSLAGTNYAGYDRFYWIHEINDKIYTRSSHSGIARSFDGSTWVDEPGITCTGYTISSITVVFEDKLICGAGFGRIKVSNTTSTWQVRYHPESDSSILDTYVSEDGFLYILSTSGLSRTNSLASGEWELLEVEIPSNASALTVHGDSIYLGNNQGQILKSTMSLSETSTTVFDNGHSGTNACFIVGTGGLASQITGFDKTIEGCDVTELVIPSEIDGTTITSVSNTAFQNKGFESVYIPSSITSFPKQSLEGNSISQLEVDMKSIPANGFSGMGIRSLVIGEEVESIGNNAFQNNELGSVTIPSSITSIGAYTFASNRLASVTMPDNITSIGGYAFQNNELTSVTIPNSVTSISGEAFYNNQLASVTIPDSVTSIGFQAFASNQLTSVTIPSSVTSIAGLAFASNQLTSVTIPDSVTSIGNAAFENNQLTSIAIPSSVVSIAAHAFDSNPLLSASIPNSVTTLGNLAFGYKVSELFIDMTVIPSSVFANGGIKKLTIGENVQEITGDSFGSNPLEGVHLKGKAGLDPDAFASMAPQSATSAFYSCISEITPYPSDYSAFIPCYNQVFSSTQGAFVRIYTPFPEFYASTISERFTYESHFALMIGAENPPIVGGYLINPAAVSIEYRDINGNTIQQGRKTTGDGLYDYSLQSLFAAHPDATDEDLASIYYRIGQTVTLDAPAIPGFVTPVAFAMTLNDETNTHTFIYLTQAQVDEGYTISPDGKVIAPNGEPFVPGAPNTGLPRIARNASGSVLVLVSAIAIGFIGWRRLRYSRSRS